MTTKSKKEKFNRPMVKRDDKVTAITLPPGMSYDQGIEWLMLIKKEEESPVSIMHELRGFPLDGMVAYWNAMVEVCGFASPIPTQTMFGPQMPTLVSVRIGPDETDYIQAPLGQITSPAYSGVLNAILKIGEGVKHPAFIIGGTIKKKDRPLVQKIIDKAISLLKTNSIYRGKAVKIDFSYIREERSFDPVNDAPQFMDTHKTKVNEAIFSKKVEDAIRIGLWSRIQKTDWFRSRGERIRSGIIAAGPYGVGKTLLATITARICEDNGWTFVYLKDVRDLKHALVMAKQYSPCVVFAEDINRAAGLERDTEVDAILNTVDGVDNKEDEIICVFTTNEPEQINKGLVRPGRTNKFIEMTAPDADAARRLVQLYARGSLDQDIDWGVLGPALAGMIPASIQTVVQDARVAAMLRGSDTVTTDDLLDAAGAMQNHLDLLNRDHSTESEKVTAARALGTALAGPIADAILTTADDIRISVASVANGK
jgi:transitional endoplasmic reticulum ATPase